MASVSVEDYSFWYPQTDTPALREVSFSLEEGEWGLLAGPTGSGKTTLLRSLKPEVAPAGKRQGHIRLGGRSPEQVRACEVGYVAQHPDNQLVMDSVWHELAFGLENEALPSKVIRRRMAETVTFFGMDDWLDKKVYELSGGQKQILNLAAVMVMQPSLLILDEPTAQLDPIASREFWQMVTRIHEELGVTVLLSEHNLEEVIPLCSRMLLLREGSLEEDGPVQPVMAAMYACGDNLTEALPTPVRLAHRMGETEQFPLTVRQGREWLASHRPPALQTDRPAPPKPDCPACLRAKQLWFRYSREDAFVLRSLSLELFPGEIHALFGSNGSGKSTLLSLLCGIDRPQRGQVKRGEGLRIGLLPQNPQTLFVADSLWEDWLEGAQEGGYTQEDVRRWADRLDLSRLSGRHPYDISGGEQQKAALVKVLLRRPDILLLDEPTKGMDADARIQLTRLLAQLKAEGRAILLSTHDLAFAAQVADVCSLLQGGEVVCTERGNGFFTGNLFYTTALHRLTRGWAQNIVTWEDLP